MRPPKDREMDNPMLLKFTLVFGSLTGVVFMLVMFLAAVKPLSFVGILLGVAFCLVSGWILFFVTYKLTFAYFWNRRARRLRFQEGGGLCVHIFPLRRGEKDWVMDEKHPVAVVTVINGQGSFKIYDKSREKLVRGLFAEPARAHRVGGRTPEGVFVDAFVTYPAWTREALELIVSDILRGYNLGGKLVESPEATRPA